MKAVNKVQKLVDDAVEKGAHIAYQTLLNEAETAQGCFYPPTVLLNVAPDSALTHNEIFGPVAGLIPFDTDQQVIAFANNSEFGLAAYCYTRDAKRIKHLSDVLETGMLGINTGIISNEMAPFGGIKQSGWGREGSYYGIEDYVSVKYLCERF
jgi:succinate-semialdehyde dehydrogenase / glutarate-semialdehyde dehydrogenase